MKVFEKLRQSGKVNLVILENAKTIPILNNIKVVKNQNTHKVLYQWVQLKSFSLRSAGLDSFRPSK